MRERTPSADDTPKRAPPAPIREAASADIVGSEASNNTVEDYRTAKLSISSASASTSSDRMVASTQSLDELGVNHPANASNVDRQQHQQQQQQLQDRYGHAYRSAQTAQDKRSRLSNVINNLRKKVPDGARNTDSPRKEEDDRNSVERNLETLEKYVMTVLNGVIKDDIEKEDKDTVGKNKNAEKTIESERRKKADEDSTGTAIKSEPSRSNESDTEAAVVPRLSSSSTARSDEIENMKCSETVGLSNATEEAEEEDVEDFEVRIAQSFTKELRRTEEDERQDVEEKKSSILPDVAGGDRDVSRMLSTIIMDRLSDHQVEERANVDDGRGDRCADVSDNMELQRAICKEILNDVLNDVHRIIEQESRKAEKCKKSKEIDTTDSSQCRQIGENRSSTQRELPMTSLHCSLPLDKVASVLQNCQTSEAFISRISSGSSNSPSTVPNTTQKSKPSPCTISVRHLCLYCDRKFLSISLRQRHIERVHQLGGGRRSERNPRRSSQSCQYCSEKRAYTLEELFQHMVSNHGDKYHACVQCSTRYLTRDALLGHMNETHGGNIERITQFQSEKVKEDTSCKEFGSPNLREKVSAVVERRSDENDPESQSDNRSDSTLGKLITAREPVGNPGSPEFDSSFYSNVSCNIRENLLHHLDGKLQTTGNSPSTCAPIAASTTTDSKSQQQPPPQQQQQQPQQSYYEHNVNQIQFPIDISLTAATPVYSKDYSIEEYENSSEYARKPGKISGSRPRRVSFEKYNFPRKYDGKEQWTCSIKDLSKFDISTQLSLRKKQQLIKERITISRLHQIPLMSPCETTEVSLRDQEQTDAVVETAASNQDNANDNCEVDATTAINIARCDIGESPTNERNPEITTELWSELTPNPTTSLATGFSTEFANFMRLRRREQGSSDIANSQEVVYAELSGEWSRPRIYICGACASRYVTLKEMEEHKASAHPNVWCSHFEFSGDQLELYKHLYLPGRSVPTEEARNSVLTERTCTKCAKICHTPAELHRHMLECGGDQAWLLGLFGNGKKKCKWRPFGSRSRRRRQRGMKRNIQNSQTQRVTTPKEKQPSGPRVRPSDHESIQKMLANLPPKRTTRKVLQDNAMRSQGRLRNVQTKSRPRIIGDSSSAVRISRNKAALRNKLLKNAKSIQRNRCRSDNISAVIESVVKNCYENEKASNNASGDNTDPTDECKDAKEFSESSLKASKVSDLDIKTVQLKVIRGPRVHGKKRNVKTKGGPINSHNQSKADDKLINSKENVKSLKYKNGAALEMKVDTFGEEISSPKSTPKNSKAISRTVDKNDISPDSKKATTLGKNKPLIRWKKIRFVNPVTSLNASIKAKSQLRTQDGKFARNPNKTTELSLKSSDTKGDDGKHKGSIAIKTKLRPMQKTKKSKVQPPRRVTRLSSDSDKMPTLEPVVQLSTSEEYIDKSTNDLPILSPATSPQEQKAPRVSIKYISASNENESDYEVDLADPDPDFVPGKSMKYQKQTKRRKKEDTENTTKRKDAIAENEVSIVKHSSKSSKEGTVRSRKGSPVKNNSNEDNKEEAIGKKDSKPKKEEATKGTRSSSKAKLEKDSMKLSKMPFELKYLPKGSSRSSTLEPASSDAISKRFSLRQLRMARRREEIDYMYNETISLFAPWQIGPIRKSPRYAKKKNSEKMRMSLEKETDYCYRAVQSERTGQGKRDNRASTKAKEVVSDNSDAKDKFDNGQARELSSSLDSKSELSSPELGSTEVDNLRKGSSSLGRRRSRAKSIDEAGECSTSAMEERNKSVAPSRVERKNEKEVEESADNTDKSEIEDEVDSNSETHLDAALVNLSLSHLQSETSNSIDSGKENSLEATASVHKLKVARPKKTWGTRRERTSRRKSLSNVIGILTEGVNIPVEVQQSVVLTVQTSLDNPDRLARNGSQPSTNEDSVIAVDSYSDLVLAKSDESSEKEVVTANATVNRDHEKSSQCCPEEAQDVNTFTNDQENDVSSQIASAKALSPASDIILDLSRRKPKGKGSFLEKIVSKIAKQKDALLEGEVGSLLDTAADELTSILDEVGPNLTDSTENTSFDESLRNDDNENVSNAFNDKESSIITTSEIQSMEDNEIAVGNEISEHNDSLMIQDKFEDNSMQKNDIQIGGKKQIKVNGTSDVEDNDTLDEPMTEDARHLMEKSLKSLKSTSTKKEETVVPMRAANEIESSVMDLSTETHGPPNATRETSSEELEKKENDTKFRRKSSKKSLEVSNSSKKTKKRSVEVSEESTAENTTQEKELDEIIAFIHKLEDTSNLENEQSKINDGTLETSKANVDSEKIQDCENKNMEDNSNHSSSQKNLSFDESSFEKSTDLPESPCGDIEKSTTNAKNSIEKIDNEETIITSVGSMELTGVDSSIPSMDKLAKRGKCRGRNRKKYIEPPLKRRSTRKRRSPIFMDVLPDDTPIDETEMTLSATSMMRTTSESAIDIENISENSIPLEKFSSSKQLISKKYEEMQDTNDSHILIDSACTKLNKHGKKRKKKSLANEHANLPEDQPVPKSSEESTTVDDFNERLSTTLEHFKVPEVTDILQSTKKRGPKKRSMQENNNARCNLPEEPRVNNESAEVLEMFDASIEKIEEQELEKYTSKKSNARRLLERSSSSSSIPVRRTRSSTFRRRQLSNENLADSAQGAESTDDLSESSCVSEFSYFRKKRFAKKKKKEEIVSEVAQTDSSSVADLKSPKNDTRNPNKKRGKAKKIDNEEIITSVRSVELTEERDSSVPSMDELAKSGKCSDRNRKRDEIEPSPKRRSTRRSPIFMDILPDNTPIDKTEMTSATSMMRTTSEPTIDTKNTSENSIPLKRSSSSTQSISKKLLDEHLDLREVNDIDIPMDIQASLENTKALEDIERELDLAEKSSDLPDETANEKVADDRVNDGTSSSTLEQSTTNTYDYSEDLITPKKRAAGNFVVMHRKTGEILIVEKRKKLTKEAARFFCDVCATSFTRKSSLKKHALSQSHLSQMSKSVRDKVESVNSCTSEKTAEMNNEDNYRSSEDDQMNNQDQQATSSSEDDSQLQNSDFNEGYSRYASSIESTSSLMNLRVTRQEALEDELLDEEICKITENMSHDEYVLTDHITPGQPELTSTPIKSIQKKEEDLTHDRNSDKKRNKSKKRNLAEEHLTLDSSPEPSTVQHDEPLNATNGTVRICSSSCEHNVTSETMEVIEQIEDHIPRQASVKVRTDFTGVKDKIDVTVRSSAEENLNYSKTPMREIDPKIDEHVESTRMTRRTLRKLSRLDNEGRELSGSQAVSSFDNDKPSNRFSLRPRHKRIVQHFDESDFEADIDFVNTPVPVNDDEADDNCDVQRRQNAVEEETKGTLQETTESFVQEYSDTENKKNVEIASSKLDLTIGSRKSAKKRGRPRLKDRNVSNSNVDSTLGEAEVDENGVVITNNTVESKIKDQNSSSHTNDCPKEINRIDKPQRTDTNVQPPKSKRGRPRKNVTQITNNSSVQVDNLNVPEPMESDREAKQKADEELRSEMTDGAITSIYLIDSVNPNADLSSAIHTRESTLLETRTLRSNIENNEIRLSRLDTSDKPSIKEVEPTNILGTADSVFTDDCLLSAFNVSSEQSNIDISTLSKTNMNADNAEYLLKSDSDHEDASKIMRETEKDVLPTAAESLELTKKPAGDENRSKTIEFDSIETSDVQKSLDISESSNSKHMKSQEDFSEDEVDEASQGEMKLPSESEDSENETLNPDYKSVSVANSYGPLSQEVTNVHSVQSENLDQLESPKRTSKSFQSPSKERENNCKRSRGSKNKSKGIATSKVVELSSDSDNEDRTESASSSKSKIVKSVFGRVFGGEKADKAKEVLNDWVSRSENELDVSKNVLESVRSQEKVGLHGPAKITENGHRKDKKRRSGFDTKKDVRSPRKKGNEKNVTVDTHGKSRNRKKREKDPDLAQEDHISTLSSTNKRRRRESKIRADERILRTFDDESPVLSDENMGEVKKSRKSREQFENDYSSDEKSRYRGKNCNEVRTKDNNTTAENGEKNDWEKTGRDIREKFRTSSHSRKKGDANTKNERSSSPSPFKSRRRKSTAKTGERIWRAFDNKSPPCLSDDQDLSETIETSKERESFNESGDISSSNNSKNIKRKNSDAWKNSSSEDRNYVSASGGHGKSRKDRKRQDFDARSNESLVNTSVNKCRIGKTKVDDRISSDFDNESLISPENEKTKNEIHEGQTMRSTSESKNRSKNFAFIKENAHDSFVYGDLNTSNRMNQDNPTSSLDHHPKASSSLRKKKKGNEDWKCLARNLDFDQEDLTEDNQRNEKNVARKDVESAISSRSCSSLAGEESMIKDQLTDPDQNSQTIRNFDEDENDDNEEDEDDDDELGNRRMSPFYAREDPDSSIEEGSSNNEEEEEGEDEGTECVTFEDNPKKTSPNEFSGEKIIIRSPSSGHKSDVVTIAPTDAIEDNALDVPREIESVEPRQGKILNFDEELFVECCSRLKATTENELRGAKRIKLDHTESYHRKDDQSQGFRANRDRWRDVESQNSLGSLLESVNQLLGEEMYSGREWNYRTRGSEQSSRSVSPDASRVDNLGYEDSLDVAFEHNNKLRDKIQQRMRESENLIASTFSQKTNDNEQEHPNGNKRDTVENSYSSTMHEQEHISISNASNSEQNSSPGLKSKMNSTLSGLLDKALSNLLHSNSKHDHNGSAPMKLLAELACARAPTSTSSEDTTGSRNHQSVKLVAAAVAVAAAAAAAAAAKDSTPDSSKKTVNDSTVLPKKSQAKRMKNPIKELFERKREMSNRKEHDRSKVTPVELNVQKQRKPKRSKKQQQDFPLIRRSNHYSGLVERKKRRDFLERKGESLSEKIKDVYEFDEEESQIAPNTVMSYRSQIDKSYGTGCSKNNVDADDMEDQKTDHLTDAKLNALIDRKFQELEKFAPKTKGALKSFQSEEQQVTESITGPMDEFVERKRLRRTAEQNLKHHVKFRRRRRNTKKKTRNAWYEDDSSDEFRTAAKAEDVGVGISKSQRACSKGKQNLFAELSTSSESELERDDVDYVNEQCLSKPKKNVSKSLDDDDADGSQPVADRAEFEVEDQVANDWKDRAVQNVKKDCDTGKSESEMSDHSLIIDERKTTDETRNSDDDVDNQYERVFELDDLYREDSSDEETETEEIEKTLIIEEAKNEIETEMLNKDTTLQAEAISANAKDSYVPENELIPLEEALNLLDQHDNLHSKSENLHAEEQADNLMTSASFDPNGKLVNGINAMEDVSDDGIANEKIENIYLNSYTDMQDGKEEPEDEDLPTLPEKLSSNEKPQKGSDNLPLHVFLSRKVQESKKRKQQQLDKLREEQERILMDFQPTRRQRKCAIGKQGLLAEISSSDEEPCARDSNRRVNDKLDHDKSRKKRESKEKRKERYIEKKHEQMIAKEQKAIEEEILREAGKRKETLAHSADDTELNTDNAMETKIAPEQIQKKKHQTKEKQKKTNSENMENNAERLTQSLGNSEETPAKSECDFSTTDSTVEDGNRSQSSPKRRKHSRSPTRSKKISKLENGKITASKRNKNPIEKHKNRTSASIGNKDAKERKALNGKSDSDDKELKTTKSWNKVEEGVGVAIGRRRRSAALQLYYWSSSSDEEESLEPIPAPEEEEEDDRQEQHGWIVGDSHKRMITMLAMEKQLKEKRRRSEDEFEAGKAKSKKHRNSTS